MTWAEVVRLLVACGCALLLGVNCAFILHARRLFATETYRMWQWFFAGKSCTTIYVGISIWLRVSSEQPLSWRTPLGGVGLLCTTYSLYKLYKLRALSHFETNRESEHPEEFK
jgi:hypothetical protein